MRSRGLTPSALRPLATRVVLISSAAKLVWRPSNSKAMALPRVFARARSMSARFAGSSETDMFLPKRFIFLFQQFVPDVKSPPCGAVLFVLRLDRIARMGPVGVGPVAQRIEVTARCQRLAAIHRDGL